MKRFLLSLALLHTALLAADSKSPAPQPKADDYPLKTCVVSGEELEAGDFVTYTHRQPGKPDREVRFCCEGCIEDFRQDPEKFLKKLDDAKAAAANDKKAGNKTRM